MTSANHEITISGKAMDLLECFVSGLDDKIVELAEIFAKKRLGGAVPVEIEARDVEQAAGMFFDVVRQRIGTDPDKEEPLKVIEGMLQCLKDKCQPGQDQQR